MKDFFQNVTPYSMGQGIHEPLLSFFSGLDLWKMRILWSSHLRVEK